MLFILIAALSLGTQAVEERIFPGGVRIIPSSSFNGLATGIESNCGRRSIQRNDRDFQVRVCRGNNSILHDGNIGEFNFTDGLQAEELQKVYAWNARQTPVFPFLLYGFIAPVTITRIVITFILSPDDNAKQVPIITMFASNTDPTQRISVTYDASDAPDTGVYQLTLAPNVSAPFRFWCIDMEPRDGTNWIIVSEVELYQELLTGTTITSILALPTTTHITPVTSRLVTTATSSHVTSTSFSTYAVSISSSMYTITSSTYKTTATTTSLMLPSVTPTVMSTGSSTGSTLSQPFFEFLQPQENPVVYAVIPDRKDSAKLNCTVFYNGSNDDIIITWTSHTQLIYTDTQSYTEDYKITTILKVAGKSQATFTCTFSHSSGWNNSRDFVFTIDEATLSNEVPIVILLAAVGGVLLFVLIVTIICVMVCCRCYCCKSVKQKKMKSVMVNESDMPFARSQINSLYNASNPMPEDDVYYDKILCNIKNTPQKSFDIYNIYDTHENIYDTHEPTRTSNRISCNSNIENSYENIYLEPIHPQELMTASQKIYSNEGEEVSGLLPYTSIYDNPAPLTKTEAPTMVSWDNIIPCKQLGNGQFGEVILAVTVNLSLKDLKLSSDDDKSNQTLVAIKTVKEISNDEVQKAFIKEIKFIARLDHENVIKALGICSTGVPFLMMEYMENGDLNSFLKKHRYSEQLSHPDEVDLPILLYIALQIVYGMKYLASHKFVHRDLAARNCLVGENFVVKVADFGMSQHLYSSHYFVLKGAAILPIRWMATESFYGKFSIKTDVWSYGVTLWEIFTLCQITPYDELNDQQVIIDILLGPKRTLLPKPDVCPDEVYEVMLRCFVHEAKQRATFNELYDKLYEMYTKMQ